MNESKEQDKSHFSSRLGGLVPYVPFLFSQAREGGVAKFFPPGRVVDQEIQSVGQSYFRTVFFNRAFPL